MERPSDRGSLEHRLFCRLPEIYLITALVVCAFLCILTPPFFVSDEVNHSKRALELGRGELLARETAQGVGGAVDTNLLRVMDGSVALQDALRARFPVARQLPDGRVSAAELTEMQEVRWANATVFSTFQNTALYPPLLYLPQVLGWQLGVGSGATVVESLRLARCLAALSAILLGWLSLRLCGAGRWALLLLLLLPTELGLNASCSQDALLLPAACLAAVLLGRAIQLGRAASTLELASIVVLLSACIGARLPYAPMAFTILLPVLNLPRLETRGLWRHVAALGAVLLLVGGWASLVHRFGIEPGAYASPALQMAFLLHHPVRAAGSVLWGTVAAAPVLAAKGLDTLGCNDVFPPTLVYWLLVLGAGPVVLLAPRLQLTQKRARLLLWAMLLGAVLLVSLSEYLIWTPVGAHLVYGLQSRYYLPLLPFAVMLSFWKGFLLPSWLRPAPRLRSTVLLTATGLFLLAVLSTPWVAAERFYNLGPLAAMRLLRMTS